MVHPSQYGYYAHQQAIYDVLYNKRILGYGHANLARKDRHDRGLLRNFNATELSLLAKYGGEVADKAEWQAVKYAWRHAMTNWGADAQSAYGGYLEGAKKDARDTANQWVKSWIETAHYHYVMHLRGYFAGESLSKRERHLENAMENLGYAIHCLQDATSAAHADFREFRDDSPYIHPDAGTMRSIAKWFAENSGWRPNHKGNWSKLPPGVNWEMLAHVWEELGYPVSDASKGIHSKINGATYRAYKLWLNPKTIPTDVFAGLGTDDSSKNSLRPQLLEYGERYIPEGYSYPDS